MAVDANGNEIVTPPVPVKVEFTPEQQEHINTLFNTRFAKVSSKHEQEMKAMSDAIELLKTEATKPPVTPVTPPVKTATEEENARQMKAFLDEEKNKTKGVQGLLEAERADKAKIIAENKAILKNQAITEAASTLPNGVEFYELKTVKKLVEDDIEFDADANQWVVKENGNTKLNSSMTPMTLTEYFSQFAAARPYLVKGQVKNGSGAAESGRAGSFQANLGTIKTKADVKTTKEKVEYITKFGYAAWEKLPTK
jgi:hypothetical protein